MIKHHLTDDLLMGYATGTLPEAVNLAVATHISMCDECRAALDAYNAMGGSVVNGCEAVAMSSGSLNAALASIRTSQLETPSQSARVSDPVLPAPLIDYVGGGIDAVKWTPVGMGVKQAILPTSRAATARLLYIPSGVDVPDHGHRGIELTLVLQGAFRDEDDVFARGDIEIATEADEHTPVAEMGEDCICLAVTDAPLKFRGLLPRIAQPFLRI
ncbi:MAG: ChrR family anti-sigma-E factor [Rhodobacteraceae bacterium]|nr:ChrR family anti-sigma-E factor [Paracoccaceae bacterium]